MCFMIERTKIPIFILHIFAYFVTFHIKVLYLDIYLKFVIFYGKNMNKRVFYYCQLNFQSKYGLSKSTNYAYLLAKICLQLSRIAIKKIK